MKLNANLLSREQTMNTWMRFPSFLLVFTLPLLQACDGGTSAWQGTVTDSAGITVVHNPSVPLWSDGDEWTVTEDLRIGTPAGEPEYQFGILGFMDVDEEGTVYAIDAMAQNVRVFDAQGSYLRTIGEPGSGPGEIAQGAAFVFLDADGGVVVPDLGNVRVNRYSSDGSLLGSFPLQFQAGIPRLWAIDSSGRLMAQLQGRNLEGFATLAEGDPIVVYDTTGAVVDTVALLPKGQTLAETTDEQVRVKLFAAEAWWVLDPHGSIYYAMSDQYRIFLNDPDGNLTRIITRTVEPKPVEEADEQAIFDLLRTQLTQAGAPGAVIEQQLQAVFFAENYPLFGLMFVGPEESLWVQRVRTARDMAEVAGEDVVFDPQDAASPEWEVFDREGRYLGVVTLPERYSPRAISGDHIYGVWRDELDVQYIMRVRVERPAN
jgi:hypothetical protein